MNEKFTPGPWEVDKENCHAGQIAVCCGDKDTYFEVWSRHWFGGIDHEANAHLIAASPELYDALNKIHNWLVCASITTAQDMAQSFPEMELVARNALEKARGKS